MTSLEKSNGKHAAHRRSPGWGSRREGMGQTCRPAEARRFPSPAGLSSVPQKGHCPWPTRIVRPLLGVPFTLMAMVPVHGMSPWQTTPTKGWASGVTTILPHRLLCSISCPLPHASTDEHPIPHRHASVVVLSPYTGGTVLRVLLLRRMCPPVSTGRGGVRSGGIPSARRARFRRLVRSSGMPEESKEATTHDDERTAILQTP